ncbi:MAG: LysM peptidoglycan-binding domain-containing protein [Simkania sp.]|nr:LysM peptidoglycan-binding domain-containing protein [Simkania sp.]
MRYSIILVTLFFGGCINHVANVSEGVRNERDLALEEFHIELGDLRHAAQAQKVEIQLLQERIRDQEMIAENANKHRNRSDSLTGQLVALEKKITLLERQQDRILNDLKLLNTHYEQTGNNLHNLQNRFSALQTQIEHHASRLHDIQQLKTTLTHVSRVISEQSSPTKESKRYRVKAGDNLEKIAKQNNLSVHQLKKINQLNDDRIFSGQELLIDHDAP